MHGIGFNNTSFRKMPHVKAEGKVQRQVKVKGSLVNKEDHTFTCQCTEVIGPGGWVDSPPCNKVIFGQENWQRHVEEGHLKCGRGMSLKAWATGKPSPHHGPQSLTINLHRGKI